VHFGHLHIEEDEIEWRGAHRLERRAAIGGGRNLGLNEALQAAIEREDVILDVVDDEDARPRVGHQGVLAAAKRAIFSRSRARSTGLVSKSSQPASSAFSRSPLSACAESAMIGIAPVSGAD